MAKKTAVAKKRPSKKTVESLNADLDLMIERNALQLVSDILVLMKKQRLNAAGLVRRSGLSAFTVREILRAVPRYLTVGNLVSVARALRCRLDVEYTKARTHRGQRP